MLIWIDGVLYSGSNYQISVSISVGLAFLLLIFGSKIIDKNVVVVLLLWSTGFKQLPT